ncbi:MAG: (2Fe-2S)-binding protein [Steroidobacteraceae bacterium]
MYVCICHGITDGQIRETLSRGATTLGEVQLQVPIGGCCGRCLPTAQEVIDTHHAQQAGCCVSKAA